MTIFPPKLKHGDTIGVVSPSGPVTKNFKKQLDSGAEKLKKMGFKIKFSPNVFSNSLGYSATAEEKTKDINLMFSDNSVRGIICSQGGQNANSVLPLLDYKLIAGNPKIFLGISDITVLLDGIYKKTGLITFHGNDVIWGFGRNPAKYEIDEFNRILMKGEVGEIKKNSDWKIVRSGIAEGKLLGGNLNCLGKLIGTDFLPDFTNAILFLEDYGESGTADEASYNFHHLDQAGIFEKIRGLFLGYYKTEGNFKIEDVAKEVVNKYKFPIIKCDDFGHNTPNTILPIGVKIQLDAISNKVVILESYLK